MAQESQPDALKEGRRIYLGNLLYRVKPYEIEEALTANGFGDIDQIHISIDPISARNPGYCFVDFRDRSDAERALTSLRTTICGRPCKVGPCDPKKNDKRSRPDDGPGTFQRWGDWKTPREGGAVATTKANGPEAEHGPQVALGHFTDLLDDPNGRRLYVGGLGHMVDQAQNQEEIRLLFAGFNPKLIGKRITNERARGKPGNHNFCFVDFETAEEANAAIDALHGTTYSGGRLAVKIANTTAAKLGDIRPDRRYFPSNTNRNPGYRGARPEGGRDLSMNWRRADDGKQ